MPHMVYRVYPIEPAMAKGQLITYSQRPIEGLELII